MRLMIESGNTHIEAMSGRWRQQKALGVQSVVAALQQPEVFRVDLAPIPEPEVPYVAVTEVVGHDRTPSGWICEGIDL